MSNFYTEPFVSAGEMEFPSQPYITAQPQNHTAWGVEDYVLTVIAAGAVSYQWEVFDGESWSTITGATSENLAITIDPSMNGWRYRVLVTGADGSTVVSKAAQIAIRGVQEYTFEGAIVTFDGPAMIKSLIADINAVQSGSGDPSPDNIRTISGWDAVNVTDCGKNLLIKPFVARTSVPSTLDNCFFIKAGTYYFACTGMSSTPWRLFIRMKDADGNNLSDSVYRPFPGAYFNTTANGWLDGGDKSVSDWSTIVTIAEDCYVRFLINTVDTGITAQTAQLEIGSTATDYEPYNGTTYPITLPNTVYGGVLDVTSGVLTVTHGIKIFDGTENFGLVSDGTTNRRFTVVLSGTAANGICSYGVMVNTNSGSWGNFRLYTSGNFAVLDNGSNFADATALKTYLAEQYANGTPLTVVYELATPIEITLLDWPTITLLSGTNNMWADSGDIQVTIIR